MLMAWQSLTVNTSFSNQIVQLELLQMMSTKGAYEMVS